MQLAAHTTCTRDSLMSAVIGLLLVTTTAACNAGLDVGPDPLRPERYQLQYIDNRSLPITVIRGLVPQDYTVLDSAMLIPYAVGRTPDRRLVNDRTGGGSTGGNTRDTTVARGQFMDIKVLKHITGTTGTTSFDRDSTLVDVEIRDTVVIVKRDHPGAAQVQVDTGYFAGDLLILPTTIKRLMGQAPNPPLPPMMLSYKLTR